MNWKQVVLGVVVVIVAGWMIYTPTSESYCVENDVTEIVELTDSFFAYAPRKLAYSVWGPASGFPVLQFHPQPTSRMFVHPDTEEILQKLNIRLYVLERPGIGKSEPWPFKTRSLSDWGKDVAKFVEEKQLERVGLIGHSAGCPHAIAAARFLLDRVVSVSLMGPIVFYSSLSPSEKQTEQAKLFESQATKGMLSSSEMMYSLGAKGYHSINRFMINLLAPIMANSMSMMIDQLNELPQERTLFSDSRWNEVFKQSTAECFRQGVQGLIQDLEACASPFGFDLREVNVPIHIWVGEQDQFTPLSHSQLLDHLLPTSTLHIIPEKGHWSLFASEYERILQQIVNHLQ